MKIAYAAAILGQLYFTKNTHKENHTIFSALAVEVAVLIHVAVFVRKNPGNPV